jgi:tRNA G18 (ribose-2'-O)-methylase SpoU
MAVEIPMHGIKQSLNVAVAYGILAYAMVNSYKKRGKKIDNFSVDG